MRSAGLLLRASALAGLGLGGACGPPPSAEAARPDLAGASPHRTAARAPALPPAAGRWCPAAWLPGGDRLRNDRFGEAVTPHAPPTTDPPAPWRPLPRVELASPVLDTRRGLLLLPLPGPSAEAMRWRVHSSHSGAFIHELVVDRPERPGDDVTRWLAGHGLLDGADERPLRVVELPAPGRAREHAFADRGHWTLRMDDALDADFDLDPSVRVDIRDRCAWLVTFGDEALDPVDPDGGRWSLVAPSLWSDSTGQVVVAAAVYRRDPPSEPAWTTVYTVLGADQ